MAKKMQQSDIEIELCGELKLKPKRGEGRQDFLTRLLQKVDKLDDEEWAELEDAVQSWFNDASDEHKAGNELPDLNEYVGEEEEEEEPEEGEEEEEEEPAPKRRTKTKTKTKSKAKTKAKAKGNSRQRSRDEDEGEEEEEEEPAPKRKRADNSDKPVSAKVRMKDLLIEDPSMSAADLEEALEEEGYTISSMTVGTTRSDTLSTLDRLAEAGCFSQKYAKAYAGARKKKKKSSDD